MGNGIMSEYLLDTHVLIWAQQDSERLGRITRKLLLNRNNRLWMNAVSVLEISRLVWGKRLELGTSLRNWIRISCESLDIHSLDVTQDISMEAYELPEPFHADPADRILAATARLKGLVLLTADGRILKYRSVKSFDAAK